VLWGGPGFSAGLVPGMQIVAVDGMSYTPERLRDSIRTADDERAPIELLVRQQEIYSTVKLDYHDGLRYPKLVRAITSSDRLASIGRPRK
jgi:predicted metalloprotease with PDZ domain